MAKQQQILLSQAIGEYLDLQRARRGSGGHRGHATVQADNNVLRMFLRIGGDRLALHVTAEHFERFFYGKGGLRDDHVIMSPRSKTGIAPPVSEATHNHYRSRLKTFTSWCVNKGYMKPGLVAEVFDKSHGVVRPLKVQKVLRERPTPMQLLALLDQAGNERDRCYLATGGRSPGEQQRAAICG